MAGGINIWRWLRKQKITPDKILAEIGRALGYRGRPDQWGPRLAFDLAVGTVSVDSLKASVSASARARAIVELQRLEKQVESAIAAMERK